MSGFRLPASIVAAGDPENGFLLLEHEMLAEKAASLGRAGDKAASCLAKLNACSSDAPGRPALVKDAASAVYAFFIQRELCGMRRHGEVIRDLGIPQEVLVRLGAN